MKLNSKSGATLAAAAATLFLAGSVVTAVSTSANAAGVKCMATNACETTTCTFKIRITQIPSVSLSINCPASRTTNRQPQWWYVELAARLPPPRQTCCRCGAGVPGQATLATPCGSEPIGSARCACSPPCPPPAADPSSRPIAQ